MSTDPALVLETTPATPHRRRVDAVKDLLDRQGGIARRRDLLSAGLTRRRLARRVERGELRALTPHLFTDRAEPAPDEPLRAAAVGLQAVVSHTSAALLWGLELAATPDERTVTVGRDRSRVLRPGVVVRRAELADDEQVERDGLRRTTVLRTVLDLCRTLPLDQAVAVTDSALRRRLVALPELREALCALPAGRGRVRVTRVLALADPQCGSVLESLARVVLALAGLRPPRTQLPVYAAGDLLIGRVDFAWEAARLVVETDGFAFHADRQRYRQDRRRGNALVVAGWRVLRFSWEDVVAHPDYVVACVRSALAEDAIGTAVHTS